MTVKNKKLKKLIEELSYLGKIISEDRIEVYAAQASFFVIISVVPFLSLIISLLSLFIPQDIGAYLDSVPLPEPVLKLIGTFLTELRNMPNMSLLSISALAALWATSRGVGAIRKGIERVYKVKVKKNFFRFQLQSLLNTLFFILLIIAVVLLLLFGDFLGGLLEDFRFTDMIMTFRVPVFALFMLALFFIMYFTMSRGSKILQLKAPEHLPGALFATLGWFLFSWAYSLYIQYFPGSMALYGGLTAIILIMLWLYFCMTILLLGAELNVLIHTYRLRKK